MERQRVSSDRPWDPVGYSRAIRCGNVIEVAGTTAMGPGEEVEIIAVGDMYGQTKACLEIIVAALAKLGAGPEHVVRTRMFVTDISLWEEAGRAHAEFFGDVKPASSLLEVSAFLDPRLLIEIEATAIVD